MSTIGVLPMAGTGSRLGFPFPKGLAPTILPDGSIRPLYWHAYDRLRQVAGEVVFVVPPDPDACLSALPGRILRKPQRGELPSSIALVAEQADPKDIIAVALPDSIWFPASGFADLIDELRYGHHRVVLGLFTGSSHVLDPVVVRGCCIAQIRRHADPPDPDELVMGWGCLVARAAALRGLTDDQPLGTQLARRDPGWAYLGASYYDLGTPDRYAAHMNLGSLNGNAR